MITQNQIKYIKSLHQSKFRQKYNNFIAEGDKIAEEILQNNTYKINAVYATEHWLNNNDQFARLHKNILTGISQGEMKKISALKTSSNVLLVLEKLPETINYTLMNEGHAIYLDNVQDPGNVGTIIRIADWFGITTVIRSKGSADFYNPKVIQATMGSFLNVHLFTEEFDQLSSMNHQSVGAAMSGKNVMQFNWPTKTLLVMGNEGKGIQASIHHKLDHFITIDGSSNRIADSLNVGIATGILCAHLSTSATK
ncbi:MAG: RNA methyltransferase [Saprospiraceae bacterium]|nr:RNA methyltransferase [Saprospiraceae bacterium]